MKALLGVQSHFSFHWGTASPRALFACANTLGYSWLGIADHASLCSLPEVVKHSARSRVRPLYGATFPLANGCGILAYIETANGYGNLSQLVTIWQDLCGRHPEARSGGIPTLSQEKASCIFDNKGLHDGLVFFVNDPMLWRTLRNAGAEVYWRIGPTLASPPPNVEETNAICIPGAFMPDGDDFDTHRLLRATGGRSTLDRIPDCLQSEAGQSTTWRTWAAPKDCHSKWRRSTLRSGSSLR